MNMNYKYQKPEKKIKWIAECTCKPDAHFRDVRTEYAPRERQCPECGKWIQFREEVESGPNLLFEGQ